MTTLARPPTIIALAGEIDISVTPEIRRTLLAAAGVRETTLGVDCSAVSFIDAGGIGMLVAAANCARAGGGDLLLRDPSPQVRRLLAIVHLDARLRAVELGRAARRHYPQPRRAIQTRPPSVLTG